MNLQSKCQVIELLLADVDGVLTDGSIIYNNQGIETKRFHVRDGVGIKLWQKSGNRFGIVTQRSSHAVRVRAGELGVDLVRQGAAEKTAAVSAIVEELGLGLERVAYIGDDLPDLPVIRLVGLGVAVADAADEVRAEADYVTSLGGGRGAVREAVEMILKSQRRWEDVVRSYLT
ncbi:MAG: HAD hydrolase family protein [Pirellulales bacterium]|jgi:YrbI family 3-deoxy-D-manno-octulosonate 8-phosphate phosphatase|nr:HAD hydrolase family protein [Thermoguttaceae bacterium]MDD4789099.1 HAD hydrolase family protein [Pirellulales bacterium]MDI9443912.1 HAD hydrolase family protein [Planctomycetota bacterium]NLZ01034.1 HAD hydrolase family protein [Pirellulaceae bacterium]